MERHELIGRRWTFRSSESLSISCTLALLEDRSIGGVLGTDYAAWDVIDGCLCFLNQEPYCIYRFNTVTRRDDGALEFAGRYTLDIETVRSVTLTEDCAPLAEIMQTFESLGDNCEFGIAQRYYGARPLDLFRFAGISVANLLKGLDDGFAAFDNPIAINLSVRADNNYHAEIDAYGLHLHTFMDSRQTTEDEVRSEVHKKLFFTRRKFFKELHAGNRIYVRKEYSANTELQILRLHQKLRSFGDRKLLWATEADAANPDGTVRQIGDGLYHGYVGRFAPPHLVAARVNAASWAKLCRTAIVLARPGAAPARVTPSRIRWVARETTYVKASAGLAAELPPDDKILVCAGELIEAEQAATHGDHLTLKSACLNTTELPDRIWYLYAPAWRLQ